MVDVRHYAELLQSKEYRLTRRDLVRKYIGQKPTVREAVALRNAALYVVRAERAVLDPDVTPDMLCKLNAATRHAHAFLVTVAAERRKPASRVTPPLHELLARQDQRATT